MPFLTEMNIYQSMLTHLDARNRTEDEIAHVIQLDYGAGGANDFSSPEKVYSLEEYKQLADRIFTIDEVVNWKKSQGLDPIVKVYIVLNNGDALTFEILHSPSSIMAGSSFTPMK